jgi:hypothetical protein
MDRVAEEDGIGQLPLSAILPASQEEGSFASRDQQRKWASGGLGFVIGFGRGLFV